jgi:chromate reductase
MSIKFLAFAASTRREAFSRRVLPILVSGAREAGAEVVLADLADFSMPIYQGDEEAEHGMPAGAVALLELLAGCQGLLLVTPEYNGFFPPLLKNTLDWMSRPDPSGQAGLRHFKGKVAGICASSPGPAGGLRSLMATRQYLGNLGLLVIPEQMAVGSAGQAFDEQGQLKDARQHDGVKNVGRRAAEIAARLA